MLSCSAPSTRPARSSASIIDSDHRALRSRVRDAALGLNRPDAKTLVPVHTTTARSVPSKRVHAVGMARCGGPQEVSELFVEP